MKDTIIKEAIETAQRMIGEYRIETIASEIATTAYNSRQSEIDAAREEGRKAMEQRIQLNIGFLRQWLNEDRITDTIRMVTDEQLAMWIFSKDFEKAIALSATKTPEHD